MRNETRFDTSAAEIAIRTAAHQIVLRKLGIVLAAILGILLLVQAIAVGVLLRRQPGVVYVPDAEYIRPIEVR